MKRTILAARIGAAGLGLAALGWVLLSQDAGVQPSPTNQEDTVRATRPSDQEIVLTRSFVAPRRIVFAALTQSKHLVRWMQATDAVLVACEVDARVGGTFRWVFLRPNGLKIEVRGAYQAFDPPSGFVYLETYDFSPLKVLVTTTLEEVDGKTRFRQALRYASRRERDEDFEGVTTSAREAYANLERYMIASTR